MQLRLSSFRKPHRARIVVAALLAILGLVVAASMWEPLHEWLHGDAHDAGHDCAITLYADGNAEPSFSDEKVEFGSLPLVSRIAESRSTWVPGVFLSTGVWEHAPPRES